MNTPYIHNRWVNSVYIRLPFTTPLLSMGTTVPQQSTCCCTIEGPPCLGCCWDIWEAIRICSWILCWCCCCCWCGCWCCCCCCCCFCCCISLARCCAAIALSCSAGDRSEVTGPGPVGTPGPLDPVPAWPTPWPVFIINPFPGLGPDCVWAWVGVCGDRATQLGRGEPEAMATCGDCCKGCWGGVPLAAVAN